MKEALKDEGLRREAKRVAAFAQEIVEDLVKMPKEMVEKRLFMGQIDEFQTISDARGFLAKELRADVEVYLEEDPARRDPKDRGRLAEPYRPAIYVE
jgi:leucyl-tRNA synthetase